MRASVGKSARPVTTLSGYLRPSGRVGFRNHVLVLPLTGCMSEVGRRIADEVPGAVAVPHMLGCGQFGPDLDLFAATLEHYALHPNVGAVLFLTMSCAGVGGYHIPTRAKEAGPVVEVLSAHRVGGTSRMVRKGVALAAKMAQALEAQPRQSVGLASLTLGVKCGSSDEMSYKVANPALGLACDQLIDAGAAVVLTENWELLWGMEDLRDRCAAPAVARRLAGALQRTKRQAKALGYDADAEELKAQGIEKLRARSAGRAGKAGTRPIQAVVSQHDWVTTPGLVVLDAPNNDPDSVSALAAAGCQVIAFTTGMGTPMGCALAAVVKIASNTRTFRRMRENMDLNMGVVTEGKESLQQAADRIVREILRVANGKLSAAERAGHREISFTRYGCTF